MGTSSDKRLKPMNDCKERAEKEFPMELSVAKLIDRIYSELLERINEEELKTYPQLARYGIALRIYRLLQCASDDLKNGYYEVAMILLRSAYENVLLLRYFAKHPELTEKWLMQNKEVRQKDIRKELGVDNSFYVMMSDYYAHAYYSYPLMHIIVNSEDNTTKYHPYPYFIADECQRSLGCWIHFAYETIKQLLANFEDFVISDKVWIDKASQVLRVAGQCTKEIAEDLKKQARE